MMGAAETAALAGLAYLAATGTWKAIRRLTRHEKDTPMTTPDAPVVLGMLHDEDTIHLDGTTGADRDALIAALARLAASAGHDQAPISDLASDAAHGHAITPGDYWPGIRWLWTDLTHALTAVRGEGHWSPWLDALLTHAYAEAGREAAEAAEDSWDDYYPSRY